MALCENIRLEQIPLCDLQEDAVFVYNGITLRKEIDPFDFCGKGTYPEANDFSRRHNVPDDAMVEVEPAEISS